MQLGSGRGLFDDMNSFRKAVFVKVNLLATGGAFGEGHSASILARLLVVVVLCAGLSAQTQGALPNVIDSIIDDAGGQAHNGTITYPENIHIGDTLAICVNTDTSGPFAVTDSLGNSYTCTSPTTTPAPQTNVLVYMCYAKSTFAGADTISIAPGALFEFMVAGRFQNLGTVDGSVATGTFGGNGGGGTGSVSTTQTTATNNDLLVSCSGSSQFGTKFQAPGNDEYLGFEATSNPDTSTLLTQRHTTTAGSYTDTHNTYNDFAFGSNASFAKQTIAFKPTAIAIADTALPDAASGVTYATQLHCVGGTAAQTYSLFSGSFPAGISLNTTTGAITGSTTAVGGSTLGFRCTDGITPSATQTLTLTVGTGFGTPNIYQSQTFGWEAAGAGVTTTPNLPSRCGDLIFIFARGDDTHNGEGWVQAAGGVGNFVTDAFGSPVQRMVGPIPGMGAYPVVGYIIGPLTKSGSDPISAKNNQFSSSGNSNNLLVEVPAAQGVIDFGSFANSITSASSGSFSNSFTTTVANTLLLTLSTYDTGGSGTPTLGAPFSAISSGGDATGYTLYASDLVTSPSTVTATTSFTSGGAANKWSSLMVPLRPALPLQVCGSFTGAGEKKRRSMN